MLRSHQSVAVRKVLYFRRAYLGRSPAQHRHIPSGSHLTISLDLSVVDTGDQSYDWELRPIKTALEARLYGGAWSSAERKPLSVGYNPDVFEELSFTDDSVDLIVSFWRYWHNHDQRLGTRRQLACLKDNGGSSNPVADKELLLKHGLLIDGSYEYLGLQREFKYGDMRLYEPLCAGTLRSTIKLLDGFPVFNLPASGSFAGPA